jgi:hypothetical protein
MPDDSVIAALKELREMFPNKPIAIEKRGDDGYIHKGEIHLRLPSISIAIDVIKVIGRGSTLAVAMESARGLEGSKYKVTIFFEISKPFQWRVGRYKDVTMRRFWFGWFAFGWTRVPFKEFCTTAYDWRYE